MKTEAQKIKNRDYMRRYRQGYREESRARDRQWRLDHPEEWKKISIKANIEYRRKNRERINEINRESYHRNIEAQRARGVEKAKRIRLTVFEHYGMRCACCGESHIEFLTIDHINGGGNKHRKEIGKLAGGAFYRWLIKNNFPDGFQSLCYNCNLAKGAYGKCPHQ